MYVKRKTHKIVPDDHLGIVGLVVEHTQNTLGTQKS